MNLTLNASLFSLTLFVGMLACVGLGRRLGRKRLERDPESIQKGFGVIDAAVFSLLGLLIAFTFSSAASKFDTRRQLMGEETNAIGTAWLRIDLLPADTQPEVRDLFRRYTDTRLTVYDRAEDPAAVEAKLAESAALQQQIWERATEASRRPGVPDKVAMLLLPALNAMFDVSTTQTVAARTHPPIVVYVLIGLLALVASTLAGYEISSFRNRSWFHALVFSGSTALAVFVIVDLEYPRLGFIRISEGDRVLAELRASMK